MEKLKVPRYIQWLIYTILIFLAVMSLLRLSLVLAFKTNVTLVSLVPSFLLGLRFDLRVIAVVALLLFLIGSIKALHLMRTKLGSSIALGVLSIFSLIFSLAYVIDFAHYAYLSQRLNGSVLNYLEDASISLKMVWQTYSLTLIIGSVILGFALLIWLVRMAYNFVLSRPITSTNTSRIVWGITFFVLLAVGIFGRVGQYPLRWSDAFALGNDYKAQIALNPFQSFFSSLSYRHSTYNIAEVKKHYPWMADFLGVTQPDIKHLNYKRQYAADSSDKNKPNVVLVICESFSAYKSSMVGNPLNTTPFFNSMVQNGIYFDRCFSPSYGTARGVWSIITGVPDVQLFKTASRNPAAVDQHTIINDFEGYEKLYFLGGSTSWANIRGLLTNNIKDLHLYEEGDFKAKKIDVWGISDKNLFLEANEILAKQNKPFFAVIQTADNHRPYTIPEEDLNVFKKVKVAKDSLLKYGFTSLDEYNAFRYTDFGFEQFMTAAKSKTYYDNTLFVFVGDHGIGGDAKFLLPNAFTEQSLTMEHIPLLFYAPKMLQPARYSFAASQLDVLPTTAGLVKTAYTNAALGRDLLKRDSTKDAAFIFDVDARRIGIISNQLFYSYGLNGSGEKLVSLANNDAITVNDSTKEKYRSMANAYYETARYLLFNNKKN